MYSPLIPMAPEEHWDFLLLLTVYFFCIFCTQSIYLSQFYLSSRHHIFIFDITGTFFFLMQYDIYHELNCTTSGAFNVGQCVQISNWVKMKSLFHHETTSLMEIVCAYFINIKPHQGCWNCTLKQIQLAIPQNCRNMQKKKKKKGYCTQSPEVSALIWDGETKATHKLQHGHALSASSWHETGKER